MKTLTAILALALPLAGCDPGAKLRQIGKTSLSGKTCYQLESVNLTIRCQEGDIINVPFCSWMPTATGHGRSFSGQSLRAKEWSLACIRDRSASLASGKSDGKAGRGQSSKESR